MAAESCSFYALIVNPFRLMPIQPFTRRQLLRATTTYPWTTDFRHLLAIPRFWLKRTSVRDPVIKSVKPRDRIKYWNVVPGDQIRLLGDKTNTLHEVLSINRVSNRVFVKGAVNVRVPTCSSFSKQDFFSDAASYRLGKRTVERFLKAKTITIRGVSSSSGTMSCLHPKVHPTPRLCRMSRFLSLRINVLMIFHVESVFAQRLGSSAPFWNSFLRKYDWQRFATRTVPVIPQQKGERIPIPWPKYDKPPLPERPSFPLLVIS